jgi:hypothetical protein
MSLIVLGKGYSIIDLVFLGSTLIPLTLIINPRNSISFL